MQALAGWCSDELVADFPGVGIRELRSAVDGDAPRRVRERLDVLSARIDGRNVSAIALEGVPSAYRTLARQLGLDPDDDTAPLTALLRERIIAGSLPSHGVVADACACALLETGVPVFALPVTELAGGVGLTVTGAGERLPSGEALPEGAVVVSDVARPLAFALVAPGLEVAPRESVVLYAVVAPGVANLEVDEGLWVAAGMLQGEG